MGIYSKLFKMKDKIKQILESCGIYGLPGGIDNMIDEIEQVMIIPVDENNLPKHKVIALNNHGEALIGVISKEDKRDRYSFMEMFGLKITIDNPTHYMEIPKITK